MTRAAACALAVGVVLSFAAGAGTAHAARAGRGGGADADAALVASRSLSGAAGRPSKIQTQPEVSGAFRGDSAVPPPARRRRPTSLEGADATS